MTDFTRKTAVSAAEADPGAIDLDEVRAAGSAAHPMTFPVTDAQLIARIRKAATELQVRASLDAERADGIGDYLDDFARGLDDLMADSLTPAEGALERNERLRNVDPKARRVNMPVETESPA